MSEIPVSSVPKNLIMYRLKTYFYRKGDETVISKRQQGGREGGTNSMYRYRDKKQ